MSPPRTAVGRLLDEARRLCRSNDPLASRATALRVQRERVGVAGDPWLRRSGPEFAAALLAHLRDRAPLPPSARDAPARPRGTRERWHVEAGKARHRVGLIWGDHHLYVDHEPFPLHASPAYAVALYARWRGWPTPAIILAPTDPAPEGDRWKTT